ncbi:3-ketoacyl-ACP reductase [Saccharospirillum sp. MSK14-1]|uniref:SDR family oxidoreductase n=1 Tax=Saccharospirillum sp. MSK14-1 TaxID=1897632 RepID=UPI000D35CE3A|nr:SDR family oxidoreductase [Saccharospirillum sp. MSK14-1]PTY37622.1 3-ketoacyl-ACP reductase [Saccharospirillum sp. MSK14-1]
MTASTQVAIVTGGSRGIGKATALRLARDGFTVVVNYAGNAQAAADTVADISQAGGKALAVQADVADEAAVQALYAKTIESFGRVDVVVNMAGILGMHAIEPASLADYRRHIATNLDGTFLMMAYGKEHLPDGGRFIAVSSTVLALNYPNYGPYIASKAGVEGLVKVFANELRGRNITVNAVAPGAVATELFFNGKSDELIERLSKLPPLERLGEPDDISGVVSFLAGPDGRWINGQVVRANGGVA